MKAYAKKSIKYKGVYVPPRTYFEADAKDKESLIRKEVVFDGIKPLKFAANEQLAVKTVPKTKEKVVKNDTPTNLRTSESVDADAT